MARRGTNRSMADPQATIQALLDDIVASGEERGLQVAVYHRGELVVDAWAGLADAASRHAGHSGHPLHRLLRQQRHHRHRDPHPGRAGQARLRRPDRHALAGIRQKRQGGHTRPPCPQPRRWRPAAAAGDDRRRRPRLVRDVRPDRRADAPLAPWRNPLLPRPDLWLDPRRSRRARRRPPLRPHRRGGDRPTPQSERALLRRAGVRARPRRHPGRDPGTARRLDLAPSRTSPRPARSATPR